MKLLFDFFPVLLFFVTFKLYDDPKEGILAATAVIIVATVVQVTVTWLRSRRIEKMHLVTLGLVTVFGGLTLVIENEMFIKWKPTVANWIFALAFLAWPLFREKTIVQQLMEKNIELPGPVWSRLNFSWVLFFLAMGVANLYVIYNFDTDTWVNFKLFGLMGLTFAFVVAQGFYLIRHVKPDDNAEEQG